MSNRPRGEAVGAATERDGDLAQRLVVHVDDALPGDAADVDVEGVAVVHVVVDQRGSRLFAAAIAAKSPVKCRLMSVIGTTWL